MYQQATEILPFAATLWKDVKFNEIHLQACFSDFHSFYFVALFSLFLFIFHLFLCEIQISFSSFTFTVFDV